MSTSTPKYIFVTGGVLSGVGKGITAASLGVILKAKGLKVTMQKCDPYLNVDADLIDPKEHGECFVTGDGLVADLDLGHYERFLDFDTNQYSTTLSGAINKELIDKERKGGFHGKTVQVVPHFTQLVQERILKGGQHSDVHITEIGGTIGDYEGLAFLEAIRLFANRVGRANCLYANVVYVPWINTSKELKTKPAQNALKDLRGFGIIPDLVFARTERPAPRAICEKIAVFSGISADAVVNLPDVNSVYDVPFNILKSQVLTILNHFTGDQTEPDMSKWREFSRCRNTRYARSFKIGLVARNEGNDDMYLSILEALNAAAAWGKVNLEISYFDFDHPATAYDGLIVPGGGRPDELPLRRAVIADAFRRDLPILGLSSGTQLLCEALLQPAPTDQDYLSNRQRGNVSITLTPDSQVAKIYFPSAPSQPEPIIERHRSSCGLKARLAPQLSAVGLQITGTNQKGTIEFIEAPTKRFFIGCQGHPEFRSRPLAPHPLFSAFIKALSRPS